MNDLTLAFLAALLGGLVAGAACIWQMRRWYKPGRMYVEMLPPTVRPDFSIDLDDWPNDDDETDDWPGGVVVAGPWNGMAVSDSANRLPGPKNRG